MMSPKSRKRDQKIKKHQIFRFFSFRLWPLYPTGINIGSKRPQLLLKHAEKQSETRCVQSFGAKSRASAVNLRLITHTKCRFGQNLHFILYQDYFRSIIILQNFHLPGDRITNDKQLDEIVQT